MLADTFGSSGTKTLHADFSIHAENSTNHLCAKVGAKSRDCVPLREKAILILNNICNLTINAYNRSYE
jgi:hypothetical protein